jgi:hypothetical protein
MSLLPGIIGGSVNGQKRAGAVHIEHTAVVACFRGNDNPIGCTRERVYGDAPQITLRVILLVDEILQGGWIFTVIRIELV